MSHRRDDIDPEKIPTLTRVVIPGRPGQPPFTEPRPRDEAEPSPPRAQAESRPPAEDAPAGEASKPQAALAAGSQDSSAPLPERAEIEALVEDVLRRRLAGLREELVELLSRELARRTAERG